MDEDFLDPVRLAALTGLEDGAIPEWGLTIIGYLGPDGHPRFESTAFGAPTVGTLVGVIEMVKHELIEIAMSDDADEFED